jgi:hypothetical protein
MHNAPPPDRYGLENIRLKLFTDPLIGRDSKIWGDLRSCVHHLDLGAVAQPHWDRDIPIPWGNRFNVPAIPRSSKWYKAAFGMMSMISCFLPIVEILCLVKVSSISARLGIIAAFHLLLSFTMFIFTDALRKEVFAVTAT